VCVCAGGYTHHILHNATQSLRLGVILWKDIRQYYISLEVFSATEFNEVFSDRQPCQDVKFSKVSGTVPIFSVSLVVW
jgi:hypothetical protein